jgi:hypothetical protein
MNWTTPVSAFIGGISGGGAGALVSYMQLRSNRRADLRSQQWQDAGLIADLWDLLAAILPERRGINVNPDPNEEGKKSAVLDERQQQISKELMRLAAGHPSIPVAQIARQLSSAVVRAATASEWHVRDLALHRDPLPSLSRAQEAHAEATDLAEQLEQAVKLAGSSRSRRRPRNASAARQ